MGDRIWREYGVQPWRAETSKVSTDPQLAAKVHDVVGLHLLHSSGPWSSVGREVADPSLGAHPARASVWPGRPKQRTHDYFRHGTSTLFAALEVATRVHHQPVHSRHRHTEFLAFCKQVAAAYPRRRQHVICDNYATHKHPVVRGCCSSRS